MTALSDAPASYSLRARVEGELCPPCDLGLPMPCACPDVPLDWRGVPITPGALVIYGVSSGSSGVRLVEATVVESDMLTPTGRVRLDVVRRQTGWGFGATRVSVEPSSLAVVALPASDRPTEAQLRVERQANLDAMNAALNESADRRSL